MTSICSNIYHLFETKNQTKNNDQIDPMKKHLETRAMFAGYRPSDAQMAVKPPMHPASTFVFPDARTGAAHMETAYGVEGAETPPEGFIYSRLGNPTITMAEQRLAAWDDSEDAALFGSGMAAISTALLAWSDADRPVWFVGPLYGGTHHFLEEVLPTMGRSVTEIDHLDQLDPTLEDLGGQRPGIIYLETPANPTMQIQRIRTAAEWAAQHSTEDHRIVVMVDNTYLGPILQRPLEEGADLVLYSATKYLGGHSDLIAGGASGGADIVAKVKEFRTFLGEDHRFVDGMDARPFHGNPARSRRAPAAHGRTRAEPPSRALRGREREIGVV